MEVKKEKLQKKSPSNSSSKILKQLSRNLPLNLFLMLAFSVRVKAESVSTNFTDSASVHPTHGIAEITDEEAKTVFLLLLCMASPFLLCGLIICVCRSADAIMFLAKCCVRQLCEEKKESPCGSDESDEENGQPIKKKKLLKKEEKIEAVNKEQDDGKEKDKDEEKVTKSQSV